MDNSASCTFAIISWILVGVKGFFRFVFKKNRVIISYSGPLSLRRTLVAVHEGIFAVLLLEK